jgi:hypothetical protein
VTDFEGLRNNDRSKLGMKGRSIERSRNKINDHSARYTWSIKITSWKKMPVIYTDLCLGKFSKFTPSAARYLTALLWISRVGVPEMRLKDAYVTRHSVVHAKVVKGRVANSRLHVWRRLHTSPFTLIKSAHDITNIENRTHVTGDVFTSEITTK